MERRDFIKISSASLLASTLGSCADEVRPLVRDSAPLRVPGYAGLAELPFFELDPQGNLRCTVRDLPPAVDFHVHLGMSYLQSPAIDLLAATEQTRYLIDCDGEDPACTLDLVEYQNRIASEEILAQMNREIMDAALAKGSAAARMHTIPNLLREMDAMGVARAVLLPIALEAPFGDAATDQWAEAIAAAGAAERLVLYASVHPNDPQAVAKLERYHERGLRGIKLHPTTQRIAPDDAAAVPIYEKCAALGVAVLFHCGRAGIEPEPVRQYAHIDRYAAPIADFPSVRFVLGHAGCRMDLQGAIALAKAHDNVWMELSGQGLDALDLLLAELGPERLLFGSDWPFYPEAPSLAKILLVTERDRTLRRMLLAENAGRLLAAAS